MALNVELTINGKKVWIDNEMQLKRERYNPAIEPNKILGEFVYSISIPIAENEEALGFAHAVETDSSVVEIPNAVLLINSTEMFGKLVLHLSEVNKTTGTVSADFASTGFHLDIETTMLQDLDLPTYDLGEDQEAISANLKARNFAALSDFRLPVFMNNDFYNSSENPSLAIKFNEKQTQYGDRWAPGRTLINQNHPNEPYQGPAENYWYFDFASEYPGSKGVFNLATRVPFFHLLVALKEIMAAIGYTATGELFKHNALNKLLVSNNYTPAERKDPLKYARVGNNDSDTHVPFYASPILTYSQLKYLLETGEPYSVIIDFIENSEMSGIQYGWTTFDILHKTGGVFEDPESLVHTNDIAPWYVYNFNDPDDLINHFYITYDVRLDISWGDAQEVIVLVRAQKLTAGGTHSTLGYTYMVCNKKGGENNGWYRLHGGLRFSLGEASDGDRIYIEIGKPVVDHGSGSPYMKVRFFDLMFSGVAEGYTSHHNLDLTQQIINMSNHLPHWSVKDMILECRKLLNLDVTIDYKRRVANFDFAKSQLKRTPEKLPNNPAVYRKEHPEPKHFEFSYNRKRTLETTDSVPHFSAPEWLQASAQENEIRYDPRTKMYYRYTMKEGDVTPIFSWQIIGEKDINLTIGDVAANSTKVNCQFMPSEMEAINYYPDFAPGPGEFRTIVPVLNEHGTKPQLGIVGAKPTPYLMFWLGMKLPERYFNDTDKVPLASPWGIDCHGSDIIGLSLAWTGEKGLYNAFWKPWIEFLKNSTPFEIDIYESQEVIDRLFENKKIYAYGQEFIIVSSHEEDLGEYVHAHLKVLKIEK